YGETEDYTVNITAAGGVGIEENTLTYASIYPNPFENELIVDLSAVTEQVTEITLLDITGKVVKSIKAVENTSATLDMSNLASGLYHVVVSGNNSSITRRILKK
ncbi:MAG: hypothetical protein RL037_1188, partial [Bacteroidota bacterium]